MGSVGDKFLMYPYANVVLSKQHKSMAISNASSVHMTQSFYRPRRHLQHLVYVNTDPSSFVKVNSLCVVAISDGRCSSKWRIHLSFINAFDTVLQIVGLPRHFSSRRCQESDNGTETFP
ncbi:hypothetical protein A0H81_10969 [Grifola frondosa]|uniref:Uncharacterized protein n=1 Tax=Grifola frondosa TaxID=5627 RepID=A0A1C7LZ91_GRIFR|nr:hypothetical protein A0H81_10969 [Grifola frondosa]